MLCESGRVGPSRREPDKRAGEKQNGAVNPCTVHNYLEYYFESGQQHRLTHFVFAWCGSGGSTYCGLDHAGASQRYL